MKKPLTSNPLLTRACSHPEVGPECPYCQIERLTAELACAKANANTSKERLDVIKQTPRQAGVDDVEWLCDEIERLTSALERAYGIWSRFQGEHCSAADEMADVINAALNIGQEIGHAKRTADEHTQSRISENHTGSRIAQTDETSAECNHDGYRKCWKCGKSLVIDCHECGAAQNRDGAL